MFKEGGMENRFWEEAMLNAAYLVNRFATTTLKKEPHTKHYFDMLRKLQSCERLDVRSMSVHRKQRERTSVLNACKTECTWMA